MIWVINSNTNTCQIYQYNKHPEELALLKELSHPVNKLKKSEYFTSDKPGRYQSGTHAHGAYSQRSDPKEVEIENFAREIAQELNRGRNSHEYKNLIIIAEPHMSGLLSRHLDKHVKELVSNEIQKDVVHLAHRELLDFIKTNTP